ncbi:MAG: pyridoxamine 5'-phosphate oxidase family protein [Erysipelotrichaceae bacterium]|nr:pyridoxamine 5'-phosphate oxidase family protein [Erysipelotrichaceae bacterium]
MKFREMKRQKQQLSNEECLQLLKQETRCVLSVNGDEGYPYGMPMNYWYDENSGSIYMHGGKTGHKIEAIRKNDKVSLCICEHGERKNGDWFYTVRSVIIFGRARLIDDMERVVSISRSLSLRFTDDNDYIESEIAASAKGTLLIEVVPQHICG